MRDPDLVFRAQLAASALESAWHRWRVVHGLTADPTPTVSSYVGYSLEEPWGQPRVVFGIAAEDAEQLATLLERHDCVGPIYAAVATLPGLRESVVGNGVPGRFASLSVPRQSPPAAADQPMADQGWIDRWAEERLADLPRYLSEPGEPLFRQAAAAMQEAAAARLRAQHEEGDSQAGTDDRVPQEGATPGSLARAATAARAEAEARIRAAREQREQPHPTVEIDLNGDPFAAGRPRPEIHATDVLEPLPRPETASSAYSPWSRPADLPAEFGDLPDSSDGSPGGRTHRRGRTPRRGEGPR
jgi:hypothetical protein